MDWFAYDRDLRHERIQTFHFGFFKIAAVAKLGEWSQNKMLINGRTGIAFHSISNECRNSLLFTYSDFKMVLSFEYHIEIYK